MCVFGVVVSAALLLACAGVEGAPPQGSPSSAQESPTPSDLVEQVVRSSAIGRQPLNPVLLPGEMIGERGILVYLLAGTTKPNVAVLGRHFRVLTSDDGARLVRFTPLSKVALELPTRAPAGTSAAALAVSHLVTDFPLETHVFASLLNKLPIYVVTRRGYWCVDGDRIRFLGDHPPSDRQ